MRERARGPKKHFVFVNDERRIQDSYIRAMFDFTNDTDHPVASIIFKYSKEGILITDSNGTILDVNPAFSQMTGYLYEDVIGKNPNVLSSGKQTKLFYKKMWAKLLRSGKWQGEIWNKRKSGELYLQSLDITKITNSFGQESYYIGIFSDITEKRQAEEEHRQAIKVFENTAEGIIITDADKNIISVNPAFTDTTGYTAQDVIGKNPRILQSGKQGSEFYKKMWSEIHSKGQWQGEIWNRRKNGELYAEWLIINTVRNESGELTNYVAVFTDITARKEQEERLRYLAHYDVLTGLPNRLYFQECLNKVILQAERNDRRVAVMFLDLDRFKYINDTLGHDVGDRVLKEVANRLQNCLRQEDTVSRLGGDEFTIILPNLTDAKGIEPVAQKILSQVSKPIHLDSHELYVTPSIGISMYPDDGTSAEFLIKSADMAMYRSKDQGNQYQFFKPDMNTQTEQRFSLEGSLRKALELDELELHYQPQVHIKSGTIIGVEALVRWNSKELGLVTPGEFISMAEETGLMIPIGYWILREACKQLKQWNDEGFTDIRMSVNVSPYQLQQLDFVKSIAEILQETQVCPSSLELEITENSFIHDDGYCFVVLEKLKRLGVRLSIDDFGTGYSSLRYLKNFKVHSIKIDRSFIQGIPDESVQAIIVSSIIDMAHNLNMEVIAEGVENEREYSYLKGIDCDVIQGFYYSRPLHVQGMDKLLRKPMFSAQESIKDTL